MNSTDYMAFAYGDQVSLILWFALAISMILTATFTMNILQVYIETKYFDYRKGLIVGVCSTLLLILILLIRGT